ncbi:MAG: hypothetical protein R3E66_02430 [bacterium]
MKRLVLALMLTAGCEKSPPPAPVPPPAVDAAPSFERITPPSARLALPLDVLAMRIEGEPVGQLVSQDLPSPDPVPLKAIGVNLCQTGWFIQGLVEQDGKLHTSPGFLLEFADLEREGFNYHVPGIENSHLVVSLSKLSLDEAEGSISVVGKDDLTTFSMAFAGKPVGVPAQPAFSAQGCFTTGYYRLSDGVQGPATAVFDGKDLYYVGLRLSEKHSLVVMVSLRADQRKPGNVIQGSLERVADAPDKFPIRVMLETRSNAKKQVEVTGPILQTQHIPVTKGTIRASFMTDDARGPIRIDLRDLELPKWDGPLSEAKIPRVQAEVLFVTDPKSPVVPVPSEPKWETQPE